MTSIRQAPQHALGAVCSSSSEDVCSRSPSAEACHTVCCAIVVQHASILAGGLCLPVVSLWLHCAGLWTQKQLSNQICFGATTAWPLCLRCSWFKLCRRRRKALSCGSAAVRLHRKRDFWHVWLSAHHMGTFHALMHIV